MRGETWIGGESAKVKGFQSTPLMRGETRGGGRGTTRRETISIHSPHTGGDAISSTGSASQTFQSTPLTRGETISIHTSLKYEGFQSTPLTRGETRKSQQRRHVWRRISIHSPHTRGDLSGTDVTLTQADFNPLPSYEGRLVLTRLKRLRRRFQSTPLIRGETIGTLPFAWIC